MPDLLPAATVADAGFPADLALVFAKDEPDRNFLAQLLRAVGFDATFKADTVQQLCDLGRQSQPDLIAIFSKGDDVAPQVVRHMRALPDARLRSRPILVVCAPLGVTEVRRARDDGVDILLCRPVSLNLLRERLAWRHRVARRFIISPGYVGPDRRHAVDSLPIGVTCRRGAAAGSDSLPADAPGSVLSQATVDSVFFSEG